MKRKVMRNTGIEDKYVFLCLKQGIYKTIGDSKDVLIKCIDLKLEGLIQNIHLNMGEMKIRLDKARSELYNLKVCTGEDDFVEFIKSFSFFSSLVDYSYKLFDKCKDEFKEEVQIFIEERIKLVKDIFIEEHRNVSRKMITLATKYMVNEFNKLKNIINNNVDTIFESFKIENSEYICKELECQIFSISKLNDFLMHRIKYNIEDVEFIKLKFIDSKELEHVEDKYFYFDDMELEYTPLVLNIARSIDNTITAEELRNKLEINENDDDNFVQWSFASKVDLKNGLKIVEKDGKLTVDSTNITTKDYSYKDLNKMASGLGYEIDRFNGDHAIFVKPKDEGERIVVIPQGRRLGKGLQIRILKDLGVA